jgi:hypothetical protein
MAQEERQDTNTPVRYRIVFVNEVGMTFFDLETGISTFRVVSCLPSLDKKALHKILETDFRMLLFTAPSAPTAAYRQCMSNYLVTSNKSDPYDTWHTYTSGGDTLLSLAGKKTVADPCIIRFEKYINGFPSKISVENPFIGMKLLLRKLSP